MWILKLAAVSVRAGVSVRPLVLSPSAGALGSVAACAGMGCAGQAPVPCDGMSTQPGPHPSLRPPWETADTEPTGGAGSRYGT